MDDMRVALVTGAGRGMGRRIAERLAEDGYHVVAADVHFTDARESPAIRVVTTDVTDEKSVALAFDLAEAEFGGVDVVVNAAAVLPVQRLEKLSAEDLERVIRVNLVGTLLVDREAVRRVRRGGAIVNFSSAITRSLAPDYVSYAASKAGVEAATAILARELSGRDITVNAVAPGPTDTEMFREDLAGDESEEATVAALTAATPLGRIGRPDDIADVVLALVGPLRWVNGQTLHVNGGLT